MSRRRETIGGFWDTGIWVGLRIFLLPGLLFIGYMAFQSPARFGLPDIPNPIEGAFDSALDKLDAALSRQPAQRSTFTPGPGAKWIRP